MSSSPKITVEIDGFDELKALTEKADAQIEELWHILQEISTARLAFQIKINQPTAGTDD